MYCKNCGNDIHDEAVVCIHCGCTVNQQNTQKQTAKTNVLAIVGFALSFFIPLAGLICSIIGYKKADSDYNGNGKGFAIAGTVIGAIELAISVICVLIALIWWTTFWSWIFGSSYCAVALI